MANNKKSFLLYCDLIHTVSKMPKEKAGELFIHILEYVNDKNPETDDLIIQLTFEPIKQALKRDLQKYETIRLKNIENANKRWNKNNATASKPMQPNTKNAVIDNDSVSVNDITIIYNKFVDEVKNGEHEQAIEMMYLNLKLKKGSLSPLLKEFKGQLVISQKLHKTTLELRVHFYNWLNTQNTVGKLDQYKLKQ